MEVEKDKKQQEQSRHEHPLSKQISDAQRDQNQRAHDDAERDMEQDAELSASSANDDLDEGESARLGEDISKII